MITADHLAFCRHFLFSFSTLCISSSILYVMCFTYFNFLLAVNVFWTKGGLFRGSLRRMCPSEEDIFFLMCQSDGAIWCLV